MRKTVKEILTLAADYLQKNKTDEPQIEAELLMSKLLGCRRLELALYNDRILEEKIIDAMRHGLKRVASGEPVQYIIGEVEFLGNTYKVDKRALIPRPETEELTAWLLEYDKVWENCPASKKGSPPVVVDVGTGTGCIILSIALKKTDAYYAAIDVSQDSLALAQENAVRLGLSDKVAFLYGELPEIVDEDTLDIIVSNPPYIKTSDYELLPPKIKNYEPRIALDGGEDGLEVIRAVIQDASIALKSGGHLFMEIGFDQAKAVRAILEENGFKAVEVKEDFAGHDRMVHAEKP